MSVMPCRCSCCVVEGPPKGRDTRPDLFEEAVKPLLESRSETMTPDNWQEIYGKCDCAGPNECDCSKRASALNHATNNWQSVAKEYGWGNAEAFHQEAGIRRMAEEIHSLRTMNCEQKEEIARLRDEVKLLSIGAGSGSRQALTAQCAAMREALEYVKVEESKGYVIFCGLFSKHSAVINSALASSAGADLLDRMRKLEAVAEAAKTYLISRRVVKKELDWDMFEALESALTALDSSEGSGL